MQMRSRKSISGGQMELLKRKRKNGAGDGIRTRDIDLGKVALYQLSYSRSEETPILTQKQ
jgi:hypothetical protein